MQPAHESDVASQRCFGIYGRVEQADTATEHGGGQDGRPPPARDREQTEPSTRGGDGEKEKRNRSETLAHEAADGACGELRDRHPGDEQSESRERGIERGAHRRPGDAQHSRGEPEEDQADERDRRGPPTNAHVQRLRLSRLRKCSVRSRTVRCRRGWGAR